MSATFAEERFRDALRGRRAVRIYPFPGIPETQIGIRLVSDGGFDEARAAASAWVKKHGVDVTVDPEFFDREVTRQVLLRATVDPQTVDEARPVPFFPSIDEVRALDTYAIEALAALYREHGDWVAPLRSLDAEQAKAFVEALKKEPKPEALAAYFSGFEHDTLVRLLISLARSLPS